MSKKQTSTSEYNTFRRHLSQPLNNQAMAGNNPKQRVIKVFISSTFRDMNEERDYLNRFVFPRIYEYCNERMIEFYPIDLRWGIQEKDSKNGLVLSACLEQIDESRPFFIGILGTRYGWIPTQKEIDMMRSSIDRQKPWLVEKINEASSITEIEMEYGVLRNLQISHACFMIRDSSVEVPDDFKEPTGSIEESKLKELKARIISQNKFPVHTYLSIEEFGKIIHDSLIGMIESEFPSRRNDKDDALISKHEYVLSRRADTCCTLQTIYDNMHQWLDSGKQFLLVRGKPGFGTSTALATIVTTLRKSYSSKILYYDFEEENMDGNLIDKFIEFLNRECNYLDPEKWGLVALDNCSTLTQGDVNQLIRWMKELPVGIHVALATEYASSTDIIIRYYFNPPTITIHGISESQRKEYIKNYLQKFGKDISDDQINFLSKVPKTEDPTYLSYVLNNLVNFGSFEELDNHLRDLLKHTDSADMFALRKGLDSQSEDLQKVVCFNEFAKAMVLIAQMQKTGISERDICEIADIPSAKWAIIRPFILKWCKGNKSKLVLIKPSWDHAIKLMWSTVWQSKIGIQAIDWYIKNRSLATSAYAVVSIWIFIWHLPIDEAIGMEEYKKFRSKLFDFACSPDVVFQLDQQRLTWLLRYLLLEFDIGATNETFGRMIDELSPGEKEEYYIRLAQAMQNLSSSSDESYCYMKLAEIYREYGQITKSTCYEAWSHVAMGRSKAAIKLVNPLIINDNKFTKLFSSKNAYSIDDMVASTIALCVSCEASVMSGDLKESYKKIGKLLTNMETLEKMHLSEKDLRGIAKIIFETFIDFYSLVCHQNNHKLAIEFYDSLNERKSEFWDIVSIDHCAKFIHCSSLTHLFLSMYSKKDKDENYNRSYSLSYDAENLSWLSGKSYMQNQATIIGDYLYYKVNSCYRQSGRQIYKNRYNPPMGYSRTLRHHPNKPFDWNLVDIEVRNWILAERDFYDQLILQMQPGRSSDILDESITRLRKEMNL